MRKTIYKVLDLLSFISSLFLVGLFITVLIGSMQYFREVFPSGLPFKFQMFYLAVMIAVVTVLAQWIEGRITEIIRSWRSLEFKEWWVRQKAEQSRINLFKDKMEGGATWQNSDPLMRTKKMVAR